MIADPFVERASAGNGMVGCVEGGGRAGMRRAFDSRDAVGGGIDGQVTPGVALMLTVSIDRIAGLACTPDQDCTVLDGSHARLGVGAEWAVATRRNPGGSSAYNDNDNDKGVIRGMGDRPIPAKTGSSVRTLQTGVNHSF